MMPQRFRGVKNASLGSLRLSVLPDARVKFGDSVRQDGWRNATERGVFNASSLRCAFLFISFLFLLPALLRAEEAPRKVTLTDGVRLILKPETTTDKIAITLFVRVPPDATAEEDATGELVSRAFLYGNENSSFESIAETVNEVGGGLETFRTADFVAARIVTNGSRLADAAHLLAQALKNADFSRDALDRAGRDILESNVPRPADSLPTALAALRAALRPYPAPDTFALRHISPETARAYFRERYTPARTVVSVVGNFDPKQAASLCDDNFFDFQRKSQRPIMQRQGEESKENREQGTGNREQKIQIQSKTQNPKSRIVLVAAAPPALDSPDYPAFMTLHALLGVGHASRLFQNIRDAQGVGYDVNAAYFPTAPDLWTTYLQWGASGSPLTSDAALKLLNAQISGVAANPPTDAELRRARALAIAGLALRRERPRDESFLLGWQEATGVGFAFDSALPRRIEMVSREDVIRVARALFSRRVALLAIPPKP